MSDSRLGGKGRQVVNPLSALSRLHVHTIPTMTEALRLSKRRFWKDSSERDHTRDLNIGTRPVEGDKARLASAMDASEILVANAIALDNRLAKKAQWLRRDEGEYCDSGLLAEGDDAPFYKRTKLVVNDATMSGEPLRVVISTDSNKVPPGNAAAFIAAARLVQQFVPLEIWWQGAWLTSEGYRGFVFLVPLVQGDMDFSRLEYCIADTTRDSFSYRVMATHAVLDLKETWKGCGHRASYSHLPNRRAMFVSHEGVSPTAESVAATAAHWLGWESTWSVSYDLAQAAKSAEQSLPPLPSTQAPYEVSAETRQRWDREAKVREAAALAEATNRLTASEPA